MSYETVGVLATLFLVCIGIWLASLIWSIYDVIKTKRPKKWIPISIVLPILGAFIYYLYVHGDEKSKTKKIINLAKNRWVVIAIILMMTLSMYVRLIDYRWPYLRNIDSYVFYRWMDETVQNNGILPIHDIYQLAPDGFYRPPEWIYPYFYLGSYSYMLVNSINPMQLWEFLIYFPPFLATLAIIPLYFIGKILYDRKAGILAAFFYIFEVSNISHTVGGDPDTDAIVILVSMITIAILLLTYKHASSAKSFDKKLILYTVLSSVILWIWYSTWAGYWYVTWLFIGFVVLKLLFTTMKRRNIKLAWHDTKYILMSFIIYMLLSFALTIPSYGDTKITSALVGPIGFQSIKGEDSQFPNVYVSVAELQTSGGPKEIIERTSPLGGTFILISSFFFMIYTLLYLLYSYYKNRHHIDTVLLLIVWFVGPFLATVIAVRFASLFSAPLAICSAIIISKIIRMTTGEDKHLSD